MKMGFLVYELGFRPKLAWELGFEAWELGFGPKLGWELGFRTPLQDPHNRNQFLKRKYHAKDVKESPWMLMAKSTVRHVRIKVQVLKFKISEHLQSE